MTDLSKLSDEKISELACRAVGIEPDGYHWFKNGSIVHDRGKPRVLSLPALEVAGMHSEPAFPPVASDHAECARLKATLLRMRFSLSINGEPSRDGLEVWDCQIWEADREITDYAICKCEPRAVAEAAAEWGIQTGRVEAPGENP